MRDDTTEFINMKSFNDFVMSIGLSESDFILNEYYQDLVDDGHYLQKGLFLTPKPIDDKQTSTPFSLVAIPLTKDGQFTHLTLFDLSSNQPINIGGFSLAREQYGNFIMHLNSKFKQQEDPYFQVSDSELKISLDGYDSEAKNCYIVYTEVRFYQTVSNSTTTLGPMLVDVTTSSYIHCDNTSPYVPNDFDMTISGGGTSTSSGNSSPVSPDLLPPLSFIKCSTWNFSTTTIPGYAFTVLDNAIFSTNSIDPQSGIRREQEIDFHASIQIPIANGIDPSSIGFRRCITNAYNQAVHDTHLVLGPPQRIFNLPDFAIIETFENYFHQQISNENCGGTQSDSGLDVTASTGNWASPNPQVQSVRFP